MGDQAATDRFYESADGLDLRVADYGDPLSPWLPVVCLPGLSRNARDFDALARRLSRDPARPRRVLAFDLRGRGLSASDPDETHYTPIVEMQDVLDGMAALGVPRAVVVGTSRGGLIAMLMGVARPAVLAGVVLNDIGPSIEARGLARLKTYVGRMPAPNDWDDAVVLLRRLHGRQFEALSEADWRAFAWMTWRDVDGMPAGDYDPALARTFDGVEFDHPVPTLWSEFATLKHLPVMAIRGENSDILSLATLERMAAEHPGLVRIDVAGEGHPPLLTRPALLDRIAGFIADAEGERPPLDGLSPKTAPRFDLDAPKSID
ncbi:MAG: alpha/beta hydrolase [Rhizobiales bacterium]|nr:alpha/beta hydrolase [Hyphomicrobiales bacterium]